MFQYVSLGLGAALVALGLYTYILQQDNQYLTLKNATLEAANQKCVSDVQAANDAVALIKADGDRRAASSKAALDAAMKKATAGKKERARLEVANALKAPISNCPAGQALKVIRGGA